MAVNFEKVAGPLVVAGIIGVIGMLWRISVQMEGFQYQIDAARTQIEGNKHLMCKLAAKADVATETCP